MAASGLADLEAEGVVDALPDALLNPAAKDTVDGAPRIVLFGQPAPRESAAQQVTDRVDHPTPVGRQSPGLGARGHERALKVPMVIDQIAKIAGMYFPPAMQAGRGSHPRGNTSLFVHAPTNVRFIDP